ncbi:MAG: insulinase family protein [Geopsychrobacter sp.]|nr:insulinase family protein [Geopsychrobacter sp.]
MKKNSLSPGQKLSGFVVQRIDEIPGIQARMIRLQHEKTGARYIHLERADSNRLFGVAFRTPPQDSTGVAHILEHTALCGSKSFPVRDPFFSMLKHSLNTFMNAMTASDWTLYPFASQNRKDFNNLLDIYLDAAFFPNLTERDFSQEGHRLEFAEMENPQSPLVYKGVVYNEMKGAMSDPSSLLSRRVARALYPTTTYHHNSGGEPSDIPDLSWQQLRDFHARYYHPSNAWCFSYGDLDLPELLEKVSAQALNRFSAIQPDSEVPAETRFDAPSQVRELYPLDAGEETAGRSMVQLAWLTCDIDESVERLGLSLLATLLLGNPSTPLYKALIDSGLGANLAPGCGFQDDNRTTCFAVGLQGTDPDKLPQIESLILETLEQIATAGFSDERIEGAIHRLEFSNREVAGDSYPYGLLLLMRMLGPWLHGGEPLAALDFDAQLRELRKKLAEGPYLQDLLRHWLLENPHRITLLLEPDQQLGGREEQVMQEKLAALAASLDEKEKKKIIQQAVALQQSQEEEEDLSCLPTLQLSDIERAEEPVMVREETVAGVPLLLCDQPTNGIGFLALNMPIDGLSAELLPLLPIFSGLLTQVGTDKSSYVELAQKIEAVSGGISARTSLLEDPQDNSRFTLSFEVKGKALQRNAAALCALLGEILNGVDFSDIGRIRQVLDQIRISLANSVPSSGHSYAARAAAAALSPAARLRELWSGLEQVALVQKLAAQDDTQLKQTAERLQQIAGYLFSRADMQVALTAEEAQFKSFILPLEELLLSMKDERTTGGAFPELAPVPQRQGWIFSVPVNYVTRVFAAPAYTHPDSAGLTVLAKLLRAEYLHREIREKGGAYGGLAGYNSESGLFSLLSYRDPHLERTLQVYADAIDWVIAASFSDESVKEAILAVFSDLDRPLSPAGNGAREFANRRQGLSLELRNQMRQRLLAVDRPQLVAVAQRWLAGSSVSAIAVLAGEEALTAYNAAHADQALELKRL